MRRARASRVPTGSNHLNITIRLPPASAPAARPIVTIENADQIASTVSGPFHQITEVGDGYAIFNVWLDIGGDYNTDGVVLEWGYEPSDLLTIVTIDPSGVFANITVDTSGATSDTFNIIYFCSVNGIKFRSNISRLGSGDFRWTNECSGCP